MSTAQRLVLAATVLSVLLGVATLGAFGSFDRLLANARFNLLSRPASGQVVFVEIDSSSLTQVGVWPWPRGVYAQILNRLMELGAADVAFDIDFSSRSDPLSDAAFSRSLDAAGGYAMLAAFEQMDTTTGMPVLTVPMADFSAHASTVAVNVIAGADGLVESMPDEVQGLTSLPAALVATASPQQIQIDFSIDLQTIDRIPVGELLAGKVDPTRIADHQVVVGASALELRDMLSVPRYGIVPGPLVQIAAAETLRAGRSLLPLGSWPGTLAAAVFALIWAFAFPSIPMRHAIAGAIGAIAGAVALSFVLQGLFGVTMALGGFVMAMLGLLGLHIALGFAIEFGRRRRAEAELVHLARHDAATGLATRLGLLEQLGEAPEGTILLVGLRRLDLVRGTLGRDVAEATLRQAADRFAELGHHQIGLIGNDVFAIGLPPGTGPGELEAVGRELRRSLRPAFNVGGHEVHVDAVLAAALSEPGLTAPMLLQRGELALQSALANPTSSVVRFEPEMEEIVARRRQIDTALRQAIDRRELTVVFQPQVRFSDGELVGVEALVRWTSPEFGPVSPSEFIPLAEETGLIVPLGRLVLTEACRVAADWPWHGWLAVNVSASQLAFGDVAEMVAGALEETGYESSRLVIEITESVLVDDPERALASFARLKALGVGIALDDFGTGYSSLSYLSQLHFDKLKIDQSFVRRLGTDETEDTIVHAIVDLARRLGKGTVAEGVETETQRAALADMGCDVCQGWLIGRPVPADEIAARIKRMRAA